MKTRGFTLVELLIVIAIIGILAAVVIPQLVGARVAAVKKAGQTHSANVYKALNAVLAEDGSKSIQGVVNSYTGNCNNAVVPSPTQPYGWTQGPANTVSCTIAAAAEDFIVTLTVNINGDNKTFINGVMQ